MNTKAFFPCRGGSNLILGTGTVMSNTRYVHPVVTPSAAWQLNCRLHPHVGI